MQLFHGQQLGVVMSAGTAFPQSVLTWLSTFSSGTGFSVTASYLAVQVRVYDPHRITTPLRCLRWPCADLLRCRRLQCAPLSLTRVHALWIASGTLLFIALAAALLFARTRCARPGEAT